jgi:hypothetical protein
MKAKLKNIWQNSGISQQHKKDPQKKGKIKEGLTRKIFFIFGQE